MPRKAPRRIGVIKKHTLANPPYTKRVRQCDENMLTTTTPPNKSRRCNSSGSSPAMGDMMNSNVNDMKQLLQEMNANVGNDTTASYVLSNIAVLLKLVFGSDAVDLSEAIDTLTEDHLGLHTNMVHVTPVHGTTNQPMQAAMLPSPIAQETVVPVRYNKKIFKLSPLNPNLPPLQASHG